MADYTLTELVDIPSTYTQGVERGGFIYVPRFSGGSSAGAIDKINVSTGLYDSTIDLGAQSGPGGGVFSLYLDPSDDIYAVNQDGTSNLSGGSVQKVDSSDVVTTFVAAGVNPSAGTRTFCGAFCTTNSHHYVFGSNGTTSNLTKITTAGATSNIAVTNIGVVINCVYLSGKIYYVGQASTDIRVLDCATDTDSLLATAPAVNGNVTIHPTHGLYYSVGGVGYDLDPSTGTLTAVDTLTGTSSYLIWGSNSFLYAAKIADGLWKSDIEAETPPNRVIFFGSNA